MPPQKCALNFILHWNSHFLLPIPLKWFQQRLVLEDMVGPSLLFGSISSVVLARTAGQQGVYMCGSLPTCVEIAACEMAWQYAINN